MGEEGGECVPGSAELDFLQSVDNLVEVEDEVCAVGDEQTSSTVKS